MPSRRPAPSSPTSARGGTVPAVARAARVLDTFAGSRRSLPLAELVRTLALPKSTVHGLCATLVQAGLVERLADGTYHLGTRVMDLAHAYMARTDLTAEFQAVLDAEAPMPEESMVLAVLDGGDIVYVGCRNGTRPFGFNFRIGMRLPANCTASGKAMLATLPPEQVIELAVSRAFYALTRKSIVRPEPLLAALRHVRARGHAVDDEETRHGMVCIGAPVFGAGSPVAQAAVAVSLQKSSLDAARKALAIDTVMHVAAHMSWRLGARDGPAAAVRAAPAARRSPSRR